MAKLPCSSVKGVTSASACFRNSFNSGRASRPSRDERTMAASTTVGEETATTALDPILSSSVLYPGSASMMATIAEESRITGVFLDATPAITQNPLFLSLGYLFTQNLLGNL